MRTFSKQNLGMLISLLFHLANAKYMKNKFIEVTVNSSYYETTPIEEGINFFNEFYPKGYSCITKILNSESKLPTDLNSTLNLFSKCLCPFHLNFLHYLLRYNYFTPRIHFYTNIMKYNSTTSYSFEPQSVCHQYVDFSKNPIHLKDNCIIRPIISNKESRNTKILNGYGVELRPFKYSMEYGVKDSTTLYKSTQSHFKDDSCSFIESEVNLTTNLPDPSPRRLRRAFFSFVDELVGQDKDHQITSLRDVISNWPSALAHVGYTEIDDDIEEETKDSQGLIPGTNTVTLNGRDIPIDTFDPFTFAAAIHEELTLYDLLEKKLSVAPPSISLLKTMTFTKPTLSVDIRNQSIIWLNDIEKDKRYKKWSSKLKPLYGALNGIPKIRRNLINIVQIIDPSSSYDFRSLESTYGLFKKGTAARMGIILYPNLEKEKSKRIFCGINEIIKTTNYTMLHILSRLNYSIHDSEKAFSMVYESMTRKCWSEIDIDRNDQFLRETVSKLKETGLISPSLWINGVLTYGGEIFDYIEINSFEAINKLREIIAPTFEGDILDYVLQRSKAVTRIIPEIHTDPVIPIQITKYSYEEMTNFLEFLDNQKYDLEDEEFPLVTMWIVLLNNKAKIKEKVTQFFNEEHKTPVRISFLTSFPDSIKKDNQFPLDSSKYDAVIIANGRVIGITQEFSGFTQLCDWMATPEVSSVSRKVTLTTSNKDDNLMRKNLHTFWSTVLLSFNHFDVKRSHFHPNTFDTDSPAVISAPIRDLPLQIEAILDPFSRESQKMIGFLASLEDLSLADISIRLNPPAKLTKVPSSFYRYVTDSAGVFSYLNTSVTYSLLIDVPETWLVEQVVADVDLDNILADEIEDGTYRATYMLRNIIVEGNALYSSNNTHCNGAQLILLPYGNEISNESRITDTIVMRNKGYWQLKANADLYSIQSTNYKISQKTNEIVIASFVWNQHLLLFDEAIQNSSSVIGAVDDGLIHIFIVASGHLYERLAKIMMLSAMNHAENTKCKFWLFQNYLSPQFKSTLEIMKTTYPMDYQLVTYRWPYWLKRQEEKQRIIWGNKILFLDALFPLSLKRVIYVDADQTIRTNMRELMTMEFGDAPYAFTPFCDSRTETEPFRFWKKGYWANHLKGKKYHISALFAIDLKKFREISAGDWLRYYYESLAIDSNSLANLDQDLPNYAQERIPIYSLPQEWLWCETWCSDETMDNAKTIDLCNNPLTKRPKLEIAQTRIKEWPKLDEEVRSIETKINLGEKPDKKL